METTKALRSAMAAAAALFFTCAPGAVRAQADQQPPAPPAQQGPQQQQPPTYPPQGYPPPSYPLPVYGHGGPHHGGMGYGAPHGEHHPLLGDSDYRSPGLAVALSLQPLPVDFGNLYAENLAWGVAYTAIEVSLMAPMMWLGGSHMHRGYGAGDRSWSANEKNAVVGLASGYVVVKLVAGLHAGYAAKALNRAYGPAPMAYVAPTAGGAVLGWGRAF